MNAFKLKILGRLLVMGSMATLAAVAVHSCKKEATQTRPNRSWVLAWSDEFNGAAGTAPNAAKWTYDIGTGTNGWGNAELQYYTSRPQNVSLDGNGNLVITARQESFAGSGFTSARIKTEGLFAQKYGRIEARIRTPYGPGIWPAFWMLGQNFATQGWPACGEIDIIEQRGQQPYKTHGSVHGPGYSGGASISKSYALSNGRFDTGFYVYAVEWGPDYIDFFVDDVWYQRITPADVTGPWVFDQPFFLILNIAVGGNFVGFPTTGTPFPQRMLVDYVRVYQQQ